MTSGRKSEHELWVRTSERQAFLTCRQKWQWAYVDRLKPPQVDTKLQFGDFVHQALAAYYIPGRRRGIHPAVTFEKLCERLSDETRGRIWSDDEFLDLAELGIGMLNRYVEKWEEEDKQYRIIASEQNFAVPIGRIDGLRIIYCGTIDGVWEHMPSRKIRFAEHKTTSAISTDALPMDEQVGAYWTYGPRWLRLKGILREDEKIDGIIYNWLRKAIPAQDGMYDEYGRRLNKDGSISKRQPAAYFARQLTFRGPVEAERVKARVRQEVVDMLQARQDPNRVYKNPGPQFMPNCKFCGFRDMCELHETGNDWLAYRKAAYIEWDPYSHHERIERR